jgi:hypothetical protein
MATEQARAIRREAVFGENISNPLGSFRPVSPGPMQRKERLSFPVVNAAWAGFMRSPAQLSENKGNFR